MLVGPSSSDHRVSTEKVVESEMESSPHPGAERSSEQAAPALPRISALRAAVESVMLILDDAAPTESIAEAVGASIEETREVIDQWRRELDERGSGIELRQVGQGWRLFTRAEHAPAVEAFLLDGAQSKLSRAALETLAVIAYRQPVTRARVASVRGVNCDGVMRTLMLRGLIVEVGEEPSTGAHLYETTELFLETMGLSHISELPDLAPLLPDIESIDDEF